MAEEKYLTIAIQDPWHIIRETCIPRLPEPVCRKLSLIKISESELRYSGSGEFAFFNGYTDLERDKFFYDSRVELIRNLRVELASDGYGYALGGYIKSDFFFTPKDKERLPEKFPFVNFKPLIDDLKFVMAYQRPPASMGSVYEQGWLQLRIGINTDLEGMLLTEEQVTKEKRTSWLGLVEREVEVRKKVPILIPLPEERDKAEDHILARMVAVCQALEYGVNALYRYNGSRGERMGEVQLTHAMDNGAIRFHTPGKQDTICAKSYDIADEKGTKLYFYRTDLDGQFKIKQPEVQPRKTDTGTRTIDRPRQVTPTIEQPKPKPIVPKPEQKEHRITLSDVVGAEDAKRELVRVCDYFTNPTEYQKWGISQKAGVLLYGPPGTGKTLLARALANEADAQFMLYKPHETMSKWSGETESNFAKLFEDAKKYPRSIILIDEFDALARKREMGDGSSHGTEARLVTMLLAFLDGFEQHNNVYLIGTTNRKEVIDGAVLERLYPIEVPLPGFDERAELVRRRIEKHRTGVEINPFGEIDYEAVARASEGLSGRTLVGDKQGIFSSLLYRAKELSDKQGSLYVVTTQNWLEEIQKVKPEPTKRTVGFH